MKNLFLFGIAACGLLLSGPQGLNAQEKGELDFLIRAGDLQPYRWFASTDPKKENNDFIMLAPGQVHRVPLSAGKLERLWSTSSEPNQLVLNLEPAPRQMVPLLADGKARLGTFRDRAYTLFPRKDLSLAAPFNGRLSAGATLIGTNKSKTAAKWYYQATVRPEGPRLPELPAPVTVTRRLFKVTLQPGEEKAVDAWPKPGLIYELSVGGAVPSTGAQELRALRLRAAWEGKNAVDAPLLALAGQIGSHGLLKNAAADFDGNRLVLRWPMPFTRGELWLKNTGLTPASLDVGVRYRESAVAPSPYRFCAQEGAAEPQKGKPVNVLRLQGSGAFLGMALSLKPKAEAPVRTFAYLEGNELIKADGKLLEGTGTEDYFSSAWYYPDKSYTHAFDGMTSKVAMPPSVAAYRFMIPDPVVFKKTLEFDFEHGRGNNRDDILWNWVCYWYQKAPFQEAVASPAAAAGAEPEAAGTTPAAKERKNLPVWWAAVGGVLLGVLMYVVKRKRRS